VKIAGAAGRGVHRRHGGAARGDPRRRTRAEALSAARRDVTVGGGMAPQNGVPSRFPGQNAPATPDPSRRPRFGVAGESFPGGASGNTGPRSLTAAILRGVGHKRHKGVKIAGAAGRGVHRRRGAGLRQPPGRRARVEGLPTAQPYWSGRRNCSAVGAFVPSSGAGCPGYTDPSVSPPSELMVWARSPSLRALASLCPRRLWTPLEARSAPSSP